MDVSAKVINVAYYLIDSRNLQLAPNILPGPVKECCILRQCFVKFRAAYLVGLKISGSEHICESIQTVVGDNFLLRSVTLKVPPSI